MNDKVQQSVKNVLSELPDHVTLVAAAKTRTVEEVKSAIAGGVTILGYNYVQEAESMYQQIETDVKWHMIGHLQRNKVKKVISFVDMIESMDSLRLAVTVNRLCLEIDKRLPVLIEVNSGCETGKSGVLPENVFDLIKEISLLSHLQISGLMTMGPLVASAEESRQYFKQTKDLFDKISKMNIPGVKMKYLSMGMSDSYMVAIEEGANLVRIGTALFGPRHDR